MRHNQTRHNKLSKAAERTIEELRKERDSALAYARATGCSNTRSLLDELDARIAEYDSSSRR